MPSTRHTLSMWHALSSSVCPDLFMQPQERCLPWPATSQQQAGRGVKGTSVELRKKKERKGSDFPKCPPKRPLKLQTNAQTMRMPHEGIRWTRHQTRPTQEPIGPFNREGEDGIHNNEDIEATTDGWRPSHNAAATTTTTTSLCTWTVRIITFVDRAPDGWTLSERAIEEAQSNDELEADSGSIPSDHASFCKSESS